MLLRVVAELLDPVRVVVELLEQLRVRDRQVVALEVVVDVDLPVALDDVVAPLHQPHGRHVVAGRGDLRQGSPPSSRPAAAPRVHRFTNTNGPQRLDPDRYEPEVLLRKPSVSSISGAARRRAVQAVGPAVVAALQRLAVALRQCHLPRPMPADVVEGAQRAVEPAGDDDRLVEHGHRDEVARPLRARPSGPRAARSGRTPAPSRAPAPLHRGSNATAGWPRGSAALSASSSSWAAVYRCARLTQRPHLGRSTVRQRNPPLPRFSSIRIRRRRRRAAEWSRPSSSRSSRSAGAIGSRSSNHWTNRWSALGRSGSVTR